MIPGAMSLTYLGGEVRGGGGQYPDDVAKWMMDHFAELSARVPPNFASRLISFGGGCDPDRARLLGEFLQQPGHQTLGAEPTLRRLDDAINECSSLYEREAMLIEHWLTHVDAAP